MFRIKMTPFRDIERIINKFKKSKEIIKEKKSMCTSLKNFVNKAMKDFTKKVLPQRDAKGRFVKAAAAKKELPLRDAKGRFTKAAKKCKQLRDAKGRFVKVPAGCGPGCGLPPVSELELKSSDPFGILGIVKPKLPLDKQASEMPLKEKENIISQILEFVDSKLPLDNECKRKKPPHSEVKSSVRLNTTEDPFVNEVLETRTDEAKMLLEETAYILADIMGLEKGSTVELSVKVNGKTII